MYNNTFGNANNGSIFNSVSVNTRLLTSYGPDSSLTLTAWNDMKVTLRFAPFKATSPDGVRIYEGDKNMQAVCCISSDNAICLTEGIKKKILPAINANEAASIAVKIKEFSAGVATTNAKTLVVTVDKEGTVKLIFVDSAGNSISHTFETRQYYEDYSIEDGSGAIVELPTDFYKFVTIFENVVTELGEMIPHGIKYNKAISDAFASRRGNGFGNNFNGGQQGYNSAPKVEPAPTMTYTESDNGYLPFD